MNELKKILAALEMLKAETDEKGRKMSDRSGYGDIMEPDEYDRDLIVNGDEYEIGRWWEYIENIKEAYEAYKEREKKNNAGELVPLCVQRAAAEASGKFNTAETLRKLNTIGADMYFLRSKIENREAPELFGSYFEKAVGLMKESYSVCPPWFGEGCAIVARIAEDFDAISEAVKAEAEATEEAEATTEAEATEAEATTETKATEEPKKEDCPKSKKGTACKYDRRAVMAYAWHLCRLVVNGEGGKACDYFAAALKETWKVIKALEIYKTLLRWLMIQQKKQQQSPKKRTARNQKRRLPADMAAVARTECGIKGRCQKRRLMRPKRPPPEAAWDAGFRVW